MDRSRDHEFAEAYRRGYERARRSEEPTVQLSLGEELLGAFVGPAADPAGPAGPAAAPAPAPAPAPGPGRSGSRRTALIVAGAAAALVVLLGAAFGLGRLVAGGEPASGEAASGEAAGSAEAGSAGTGAQGPGGERPAAYDGPVRAVGITGSTATCQAGPSVDVAGNPVTYEPARAHDADLSTAWRCPGNGRGERLTLTLPEGTAVAQVGLVPGYAKTDSASGEDRYAQNNRITRVRWHFDDGSSHVQRMRGNPADRSLRTLRVPETVTSWVELEILASAAGPRDTVAVSELAVAEAAG